ncbi:MAG: hypothetical protein PHS04_08900 [Tissierellia bacterium]|nr:hypothetical protein [Tissierellia bacterium]
MKILILDDDQNRLDIFRKNIEQKLKVLNSTDYAKTAKEAIEFLRANSDYDYIFLDRDLGEGVPTGEDVVSFLIDYTYPTEKVGIVIHSWNIPAGKRMHERLLSTGYNSIHQPGAWATIG